MSKLTPGPWAVEPATVREDGQPYWHYIVRANLDGDWKAVASTWDGPNEADARLIAAAPDLYSALVAVEQAYRNKHSPKHRAACLAQASAAIAKAKGK